MKILYHSSSNQAAICYVWYMKDFREFADRLIELAPYVDKEHLTQFIKLTYELRDYIPEENLKRAPYGESKYLTLDEICSRYNLAKNNVKSRQWRKKMKFPMGNEVYGGKLSFNTEAVEEWMNEKYN